jgi:hypothetical protein
MSHLAFENARLLGDARRAEAPTDSTFDNALAWLRARGVVQAEPIQAGRRGGRDTRYAPGEAFSVLHSLESILASRLRDR